MNTHQSIRKKIALAIAASLGVGLLLSFLTFAVREIDQRRQAKTTELLAMADVVAFNASAVIEFRDVTGAKRLLSSFAEHKDVLAVRLIGITRPKDRYLLKLRLVIPPIANVLSMRTGHRLPSRSLSVRTTMWSALFPFRPVWTTSGGQLSGT